MTGLCTYLCDQSFLCSYAPTTILPPHHKDFKSRQICLNFSCSVFNRYTLLRDGVRSEFGSAEIVVGDVLEFKYGNTFPCDGLLIQGNDVAVSESSLTGETENIRKKPEKDPFMYAGTQVWTTLEFKEMLM